MTTDSPGPQSTSIQGIPKVRFKATPHFWEMVLGIVVACITVVGSVTGVGKWYFAKSAEDSSKAEEARKATTKLHQVQFKMFLSSIVESKNTKFTDDEKRMYSSMLQDITYEDVKSLLDPIHFNRDRQDLDFLIDNNQVEPIDTVTDLKWNNGSPAQIRFIRRKNPSLDFQKIDLFSAAPDACSSKVIPLGNSSNATVEICESHLSQKLEIIVIQPTE
jgi:hypothetical protein